MNGEKNIILSILAIIVLLLPDGELNAEGLPDKLRVGVKVSEPFVMLPTTFDELDTQGNADIHGKAIDVWNATYGGESVYTIYSSIDKLIEAVSKGEVDVGVGPISVTNSREQSVDFLHSYFQTGLSYATVEDDSILNMFLSIIPKLALGILVIVVVIVPTGWVWATIEKRGWPTFDNILDGSYWSSATLTTVGYGDENTKTRWGKAYSIVLMWSGMFITSLLTGYVLILVTVESGANDFNLLKSKIAVVDGSSGLHFIESMVKSRKIHKYESLDAAVQSVVDGKTDAVIHDKALLDHASGENPTLSVSGDLFNEDYYAFAVPEDSRYLEELNRSMLLNR